MKEFLHLAPEKIAACHKLQIVQSTAYTKLTSREFGKWYMLKNSAEKKEVKGAMECSIAFVLSFPLQLLFLSTLLWFL